MEFYDDKIYSYKMKKDNFDLRQYLVENKMTENSRGETRLPVGECFLDTRILSEMRMPADPYDHHDPDYDEDWASKQDAPDDIFAEEQGSEPAGAKGQFLDMLAYANDYSFTVAGHQVDADEEWGAWDRPNYNTVKIDGKPLGQYSDDDPIFSEINPAMKDFIDYEGYEQDYGNEQVSECGDLGGDMPLDEAGYTDDDDDDYASDDLDLDDRGGASLLDLVRGDKKANKARKVAAVDTAADPAMDDEPVDTDAPEIDDPEGEEPADTSDPNAEAQPGLSAQVKYNPNTVEMMMDDQELDQYLSGFRRPQVAVNVLNRAIRAAQDEVNESIGLKHLYIILENGFYVTSRSQRGQVIAKVTADQAWRDKNFS